MSDIPDVDDDINDDNDSFEFEDDFMDEEDERELVIGCNNFDDLVLDFDFDQIWQTLSDETKQTIKDYLGV